MCLFDYRNALPLCFTLAIPPLTAFDQNGLRIDFNFEKQQMANQIVIRLSVNNATFVTLEQFVFQAAVTKVIHSRITVIFVHSHTDLVLQFTQSLIYQLERIILGVSN